MILRDLLERSDYRCAQGDVDVRDFIRWSMIPER